MADDIVEMLRTPTGCIPPTEWELAGADEIVRLRNILRAPLSSAEMRLIDKHCPWIAFSHAWNAVIKGRLEKIANR